MRQFPGFKGEAWGTRLRQRCKQAGGPISNAGCKQGGDHEKDCKDHPANPLGTLVKRDWPVQWPVARAATCR